MSIKQATDYLNYSAKSVKVNDKIYVEKSEVIHSLQFASKIQAFQYEKIRPKSSGFYLVKEYGKHYSKCSYYDSRMDSFKSGMFVLDVELWANMPELEL